VVNITAVQALYQELTGEPEVLAYCQGLLVDVLRREVLGDAAVVGIAQLNPIVFVIEEVVNIDIVHIALDVAEVDIVVTTTLVALDSSVAALFPFLALLLLLLVRLFLIGLLEPGVR